MFSVLTKDTLLDGSRAHQENERVRGKNGAWAEGKGEEARKAWRWKRGERGGQAGPRSWGIDEPLADFYISHELALQAGKLPVVQFSSLFPS